MSRRVAMLMLAAFSLILIASPAMAQEHGASTDGAGARGLGMIAAGFSMAFASAMCGLGQGKAVSAACEGIARNPGAGGAIRIAMIIGLVFIESLALYTLVIVFVKITV
jgi:F-type H+-transporting ATPase subunit c